MKALVSALLLAVALAPPASAGDIGRAPSIHKTAGPARAEIAQDYEPDPAMWLLEDEDTRIYLFGTIHVLPEGFRWRSARLDGVVAEADELIVETTDEDIEGTGENWIAELIGSIDKRPRISDSLSPANRSKWLALGKSAGLPAEYFDRLPPMLALSGMAMQLAQEETGSSSEYGVETVLEAEFRSMGKPIGSIESAAEVMSTLLGMDQGSLIKDIDRQLSAWDGNSLEALFLAGVEEEVALPAPFAVEHSWAQGDEVDVRAELMGDTAFGREMGEILLDNRNRAWAEWLERKLETPGTVLVAVGAGHLAGDHSLQVMLSERGLATTRLD